MCGNPRKFYGNGDQGLTLNEKKQYITYRESKEELDGF
jgi:hypothetical protein